MSWLASLRGIRPSWRRHPHSIRSRWPRRGAALSRLHLEGLETRCLMSATLVKDLNTTVGSSILLPEFTDVNGTTFFLADDGIHGRELWKTDGTAAGTHLVKDIYRGGGNAFNVFPAGLIDVNGTLFFSANDGVHGYQLWTSDGTAAGTIMVTDINFGSDLTAGPHLLANVNGTLFFSAQSNSPNVAGLWKSDGTPAGTVRVSSAEAGVGVDVNGTLFFLGGDTEQRQGLWKSDGTPEGTVFLQPIADNVSPEMVNVDGTLFFTGDGSLWKSKGTPRSTHQVDMPGDLTYPEHLTVVNGTLFFQAAGLPSVNPHRELWKTDGTKRGTVVVKNINPNGDAFRFQGEYPMAGVNGSLYFVAFDGTNTGLWKSDGTTAGTVLVSSAVTPAFGDSMTSLNGSLYFNGSDPSDGRGLWKSDGTPDGTVLVKNLNQVLGLLANVNGRLFFSNDAGIRDAEPWTSDGTTEGTVMLKDIFPGNQSANIQNPTELNGLLYFMNSAGDSGNTGLLVSDGTVAGTVQVSNVVGSDLTASGGVLYFAGPGIRPFLGALWESDGTSAGTVKLKDLGSGSAQNLTDVNGTLFFTFDTQLWVSDGTPDGTVELLASGAPANLTNGNGMLFFTLDDGTHGRELWESDGTVTGTVLVKDINVGGASSNPQSLTNVGGTLYFSADDGVHGRELWKSDGTPDGTVLAADINPGGGSSNPTDLTVSNGFLYFVAATPATGRELWQYDPNSGTVSVFDIKPGMGSSNPSNLTDVNGLLFFAANDGVDGQELWATDGTQAGTHLVADILPGKAGSKPEYLYAWNGILYFTANDGVHGRELWQSDGTAAGTFLVQDINPGKGSAFHSFYNPEFTAVGNQLFFVADDRIHGRELWVYTPDNAPAARHPGRLALSATVVADHQAAAVALNRSARLPATGVAVPATLPPSSGVEDRSLVELSMLGLGESGGSQALPARLSTRKQPTTAWEADLLEPDDRLLDEVFRTLAER